MKNGTGMYFKLNALEQHGLIQQLDYISTKIGFNTTDVQKKDCAY